MIKFNYDKYNPTRGGSYIELPKWVSLKKACINIKNEDDNCFKYCIQCGVNKIYEKDHPDRIYHYKKLTDNLNWDNVNFPTSAFDIDTFEENNKDKIAVNVFYIDNESLLIYRRTKNTNAEHKLNLLLLDEGDKSHYVFIKNYDRLLGSQTNKKKIQKHHCFHCGHGFMNEKLLKEHETKGCMTTKEQGKEQVIEMPKEEDIMVFKNHYKKLKAPFVICADFECLTERTGTITTKELKTDKYQHHRPCSFMINVVNSIDGSSEPFLSRGEDCMDVFVKKMVEVKDKIVDRMKENKEMIFNANNRRDFMNATKCFICGEDFVDGDVKVQDHCHFTGRYRGCAHQDCNLQFAMR